MRKHQSGGTLHGMASVRTIAVWATTLGILVGGPAGADRLGATATFLGWNPDSSDFAWTVSRTTRKSGTTTMSFMKRVTDGRIAERKPYKYSVPLRVEKKGYMVREVERVPRGPFEQVFRVSPTHELRVRLEVGRKKLGYTIYLDDIADADKSRRMIGGVFDEVWTDFEARVFRSPNGEWVAVVMAMSTPYRSDVWVEGLRVGAPR